MVTSPAEQSAARWVGALFLLIVLLQRFAVPGVPLLAVLVPVVLLWAAAGLVHGVVTIDRTRLAWWFAAATATAITMLLQPWLVPGAQISVTAWGLVLAVWLPFTVRLIERGAPAYLAMLRYVTTISTGLAWLALIMVGVQLSGVAYRDWFAAIVPSALQLDGFVLTYPIAYGSTIFRANAWIGLEPSMVSAQLGLGLLAALFVRARIWTVIVLVLGLVSTVSGSGIIIVLVGGLVMLLHRSRRLLGGGHIPLAVTAAIASTFTPFGIVLIDRSTEYQSAGSSTSLRALEPYSVLYPAWIEHLPGMLLGYGPGSAQRVVNDTNVPGLLVPSPVKVFFEYGIIAGLVLATFILGCYWGSPSRTFSLSLLCSLLLLQPGITTIVVVAPLLVLVTLWSPRVGPPIESILPERRSADRWRSAHPTARSRDIGSGVYG